MLPCSGKPVSAIESDDRLIAAWTGHPHLRIIDNRYSFDEKMLALIREVTGEKEFTNPYIAGNQ